MGEHGTDRHLIGHIVKLLDFLQEHGMDPDGIAEERGRKAFFALPGAERFRAAWEMVRFMDEMPGGFLIYYADGGEEIVYANRAVLRIFQCRSMAQFRALTGGTFRGMVHPEDLEAVERSIRVQVAASQYDLDYVEYRILRRDGAVRWIEDYGHFMRDESARDIFYVFLGDATEKQSRRMAERARLLEAFDRERSLLNQEHLRRLEVIEGLGMSYEAIFYVDLEQDQIMPYRLSSRSESMFREEFQKRGYSQTMANYANAWVHPEDVEAFSRAVEPEAIWEKLSAGRNCYVNYRVLEDGEAKYLQMRAVTVGRQEEARQLVMGFRRVDEELQHELEQKRMLAQALDSATRAMGAKDTFLSNMSHDMRTPLNAIFGFTTLAKRHSGDPEAVQGYLDRVETAGRQLLDLIDKVLELSQTQSGQARVEEAECSLEETIREVYDFLLPQAMEKEIDFTLNCDGIVHNEIYGDQEKLKQLIMYLANNAVTYTKSGGRVSITAAELETLPNQYAVYQLLVEDNGIGVSEEFLERIFEPFAREKNTTLSGIHGIGLGLTIAKSIVDMMGGTIAVRSAVGKGSAFTITLRFRVRPRPVAAPDAAVPAVAGPVRQSILLVEDNEINREIETEILQELGFLVDTAEDGKAGLEKLERSSPGQYDVVLMDIQMPVMDGWQAAQAIRALPDPALARVPIIALSANVFESDKRRSVESGMDAHLAKPLDVGLLLETMEALVGRRMQG